MLNALSVLIGLFALLLAIPAFIPLLGWAYWIILPIAFTGLLLGLISTGRAGRNLNAFVVLVGLVRLTIGHGIF